MSLFGAGKAPPTRQSLSASSATTDPSYTTSPETISPPPELNSTSITDEKNRSTTSSKKRFTASWGRKRRETYAEDGTRGRLGLQLLHSSPEPLVDLIFVHGLRGGSIKTWRKGTDHRLFWPQFWLPTEPALRSVSIHSFGYDSDWASSQSSVLNIHDFGQSLLEEMRNSPYLKDRVNGPIILLGHSMGGLVIKKTFSLSRDVPELRNRIQCLFFLATPHRGSDDASTLNNILTVSGVMSPRHYVNDLMTGSTSIQTINDDFGRAAHDLPIFSFYETIRTSIGVTSSLIVEKSSAVLGPGYRNERVQYLAANHRDVCKYEDREDPNYIAVKNALASAVDDLLKDVSSNQAQEYRDSIRTVKRYLGVEDAPDEQYSVAEGCCQWLDFRDDFEDWRDSPIHEHSFADGLEQTDKSAQNPAIYWVHANPGAGKTYLSAHVAGELEALQLECAKYFFHFGNKSSRSLSHFLRSMALQMAMSNAAIRSSIISLYNDGSSFDLDDSLGIWTKVFRKCIFQARVYNPQYWVIDAVDECSKYQEFFTMLRSGTESIVFPLRIFVTSRKIPDMQRILRPLQSTASVVNIEIPESDSIKDIKTYITTRMVNLSIDDDSETGQLSEIVLQKSHASFLWVRLVLDELERVYSQESIIRILHSIPEGMIPYYERTVKAMAGNKLEKHIAKAVLLWTVAGARKLTVSELSHALELDIETVLPSAKSAVEGLCGQLVVVDHWGVVDVIHPTAQEFLLSDAAAEFMVSKPTAHERIALACLKLLSSVELQPPRTRRVPSKPRKPETASPLLDYAMTQFSEHVYSASAEKDDLLVALDRFFRTNVLSWIQRLTHKGDLHTLIRTSRNLKAFLDRRAKYRSPLNNQVRNAEKWSVDLSRVVTKFGTALQHNSLAIFFLIPPLCPLDSAIYQQFGKRADGLVVVGSRKKSWDDCIASVGFGEDIPSAVSCGDNLIAVGMESGLVHLYNHKSFQKQLELSQQHPVDLVHFGDKFLVVSTTKFLILQDLNGNIRWQNRLRFRCILLTSDDNSVVCISQHGHVLRWDLATGKLLDDTAFDYRGFDTDFQEKEQASKAPFIGSLSADMEILALGYRGGAVCLWELRTGELMGWARDADESNCLASNLLFNPNPNISLLLVTYTNHKLSLYDSWSGALVHSHEYSSSAAILSATCSPDGRTLATTDMQGNLHIWDFESLVLIYHVVSPSASFRILAFTSDGSSIVDVVDSGMKVWSPPVLVRKNIEEDTSVSDDAVQLNAVEGQYHTLRQSKITALCAHPSLSVVFAGKYNGDVIAFSTKTGLELSVLYSHAARTFVTQLEVSQRFIASSDVNGGIEVWKIAPQQGSKLGESTPLLQFRSQSKVKQFCFLDQYVLISTVQADQVYSLQDGTLIGTTQLLSHERETGRWTSIPAINSGYFGLIVDKVMRTYSAAEFPSPKSAGGAPSKVRLQYSVPEGDVEKGLDIAFVHESSSTLVLGVRHGSSYAVSSSIFFFDLAPLFTSPGLEVRLLPLCKLSPEICKQLLGTSDRLKGHVFLGSDGWVSSVKQGLSGSDYTQHLFVPDEYMSAGDKSMCVKTSDDEIVFCSHGELSIIRNGLR